MRCLWQPWFEAKDVVVNTQRGGSGPHRQAHLGGDEQAVLGALPRGAQDDVEPATRRTDRPLFLAAGVMLAVQAFS